MAKSSPRQFWLMKSEPASFSFDDLWRAKKRRAGWDGVRNYQARNFMRDAMRIGDGVLFYHSGSEPPGVAGIARIASAAYPDATQFDPSSDHFDRKSRRDQPAWVQIDVEAIAKLAQFVALDTLRSQPDLAQMALVQRGQRLSVQPVKAAEWDLVLRLGGLRAQDF